MGSILEILNPASDVNGQRAVTDGGNAGRVGFGVVAGKYGGAGHKDIGARRRQLSCIFSRDATIDLDVDRAAADQIAGLTDFLDM